MQLAPIALAWVALGLLAAPPCEAGWTLAGTAVDKDKATGLPGVLVTVHPEMNTVITDSAGDFVLPWSGKRGFITMKREGIEWCKRVPLFPKEPTSADSLFDMGMIIANTERRYFSPGRPTIPAGTAPPDTIRATGPGPNDPDRYWVVMKVVCDIYGQLIKTEQHSGETPPASLQKGLSEWLKTVPWKVGPDTTCDNEEPFVTTYPFTYRWEKEKGVWVLMPNQGPTRPVEEPKKPAEEPPAQGKP